MPSQIYLLASACSSTRELGSPNFLRIFRKDASTLSSKEGDRNIGFFHRMANAHTRKNIKKKSQLTEIG